VVLITWPINVRVTVRQLAHALALGAGLDRCGRARRSLPGQCSHRTTGVELELDRGAVRGLGERDLDTGLEVAALHRAGGSAAKAAATAERAAERATEAAAEDAPRTGPTSNRTPRSWASSRRLRRPSWP